MILMVIFLYGKDTFRSRQHLKRMIEKFRVDRDPNGYNVVRIDAAAEKQSSRIMSEILASPFLAERRMVVVESLLSSKQHTNFCPELLLRIEEKKIPDTTILICWEAGGAVKGKEASALFERLTQEKYTQEFSVLVGAKFAGWIAAETQVRGGSISSQAAEHIANHAFDTWQANSLIDALLAYKNGEEIHLEDTELFLDERGGDMIFALVDAAFQGRLQEVYTLLRGEYARGADISYLFAMMLRQCRILIELRDLLDREDARSSDMLAKTLDLHPFVVKKSLGAVKQTSLLCLKNVYTSLLQLDIQIKTGRGNPEMLFDFFVGRMNLQQSKTSR